MNYSDGTPVMLDDVISIPVGDGKKAHGCVVMLGDTYEHLPIDDAFLSFILRDKILRETAVVVEWIESNPFEHSDPNVAPVGNYMTTDIDDDVYRVIPRPSFKRRPDETA